MRLFFVAVEVGVILWLLYIFLTQLIIPLFKGRQLLPALRKADKQLDSEEVQLATELERELRRQEIDDLRQILKNKEKQE